MEPAGENRAVLIVIAVAVTAAGPRIHRADITSVISRGGRSQQRNQARPPSAGLGRWL